ncbi:MAG: ATP-binding protein [Bdellovibrionales bacterium]|nr:ATP-binding protein [Bdellovibrionales bacterium]
MSVHSFVHQSFDLQSIEVEISLLKGLPNFQIMGMPDSAIKESLFRIKSALKHQGFSWPKAQQVLVNLRPAHVKKTSPGLDLAIAYAYLLKTKQIKPLHILKKGKLFAYGELNLEGKIFIPENFLYNNLNLTKDDVLVSGIDENFIFSGESYFINSLSDLKFSTKQTEPNQQNIKSNQESTNKIKDKFISTRPQFLDLTFPLNVSELLSVAGVGGHSLFLAGPAGSGKSTFCKALHQLQSDPSLEEIQEIKKISQYFGKPCKWRPLVSPHHSTPALSIIGCGYPPQPGEITRANGGTLVLDEFLEFASQAQEALREPLESGEIFVSRRGKNCKFPAKFQLIATSNLCKCGDLVPKIPINCSYSLARCRSYLEKLSGPLLDRFSILSFTHKWKDKSNNLNLFDETLDNEKYLSVEKIFKQVQSVREFIKKDRPWQKTTNHFLLKNQIIKNTENIERIDEFYYKNCMPLFKSYRRELAFLRVARTYADLDLSSKIEKQHLEKAREMCVQSFYDLKQIFC